MKNINLSIVFAAALFWLDRNVYFGWHGSPQSDAELICTGINLLILVLAFLKIGPKEVEKKK